LRLAAAVSQRRTFSLITRIPLMRNRRRNACQGTDTSCQCDADQEIILGISVQAAKLEGLDELVVFSTVTSVGRSLRCDRAQFSHSTFAARRLLPDKGKPTARWGRKATDQAMGLMAGLPKGRAN